MILLDSEPGCLQDVQIVGDDLSSPYYRHYGVQNLGDLHGSFWLSKLGTFIFSYERMRIGSFSAAFQHPPIDPTGKMGPWGPLEAGDQHQAH